MGEERQLSMSHAANNVLNLSSMTDSENQNTQNDLQKRCAAAAYNDL